MRYARAAGVVRKPHQVKFPYLEVSFRNLRRGSCSHLKFQASFAEMIQCRDQGYEGT